MRFASLTTSYMLVRRGIYPVNWGGVAEGMAVGECATDAVRFAHHILRASLAAKQQPRPISRKAIVYEIHGWIKLAESASEINEGGLDAKCDKLRGFVREISWPSGVLELAVMNGVHVLIIHAAPNRRRSEADDLDRLPEFVIREFKGAYGVVYEYDEQAETAEGRGIFSVKVLKRGRCELALDPFLSPAIPVVEDPS